MILEQIDRHVFGKKVPAVEATGSTRLPTHWHDANLTLGTAALNISTDWAKLTNSKMNKLFIGPAATITRLHYDAHDAHGWLAQVGHAARC